MTLSLTFDHRIVDGGPAARFLQTLAQCVENPAPWLVDAEEDRPMKCDCRARSASSPGPPAGSARPSPTGSRPTAAGSSTPTCDDEAAGRGRGRADGRWLRLDVTSADEIAAAVRRVVAECGRLDILVNNAGVNTLAHRVTIDEFPREEWDRILAVDLTGVYEVSRARGPRDAAQARGRIINIASHRRAGAACGCSAPSSRPRRAW